MLRAYHHWDFPKGLQEDGENSVEAAKREVAEETSITDLEMEWGERFLDTGPYSRGKTARYYLARTGTSEVVMGLSPETGVPEHHEWRWVSFDQAYDLSSPRVKNVVKWARQIIGK
jgi:8-oxo-dGTP pyrophosphatase MutT (NUDIX family)